MRIKASEFKAKCLQLMDRVGETGETIVITENGRAVARMGPVVERPATLFGLHADRIEFDDDLIEPATGATDADASNL